MISARCLATAAFAALLLALAPGAQGASAQGDAGAAEQFDRDMRQAQELFRQGLDKMVGSVETLLRAVPQYELPRINENGDIIIRRKHPDDRGDGHDAILFAPNGPTI